jgi:hypothetical protein
VNLIEIQWQFFTSGKNSNLHFKNWAVSVLKREWDLVTHRVVLILAFSYLRSVAGGAHE